MRRALRQLLSVKESLKLGSGTGIKFLKRVNGQFLIRIAVHPGGTSCASGGEDGFVRVHHFDDSYYRTKPYGDLEIISILNVYVITI